MDTTVIVVILGVLLFFFCLFLLPILLSALFIRRVGPNQVMIIYGAGGTKVVSGGSHIVYPRFQRIKSFSLELMSFSINLKQEISLAEHQTFVNVEAVALIKVRTDEPDISVEIEQLQRNNQLTRTELLRTLDTNNVQQYVLRAVELFLDKSEAERADLIRIVIEGHLRGLIRQRTFDELMKESEMIIEEMFKTTFADLNRMGLELVSFTLQEIRRLPPET